MKLRSDIKYTSVQNIDVIVNDIENLIVQKNDFMAFVILSIGIEFLGCFLDEKDYDDFEQSTIRFKNALTNLFKNNWYKNNSDFIYKAFRGRLIHQYRVGEGIFLTSKCKNNANLDDHLKVVEGARVFVLEQLFLDFKTAANRLKNIINKSNSLNKIKLDQEYYSISDMIDSVNEFNNHLP